MPDDADTVGRHEVLVVCEECGAGVAADSPDLRLELTCDDLLRAYCLGCWQPEVVGGD